MSKAPLWTQSFIAIAGLNFLATVVFYLLIVVVALYASRDLQASVSESGFVVGIFILGALTGRLLCGQIIERAGRKRTMIVGLLLSLLACLLYFLETGIAVFAVIRYLHGVASGATATAIATVIASLIPLSRRGEGIGYFSISTSMATAIGPFLGIYLMQIVGFDMIIVLCCALTAVCVLLVALALTVPEAESAPEHKPKQLLSLSRWFEPRVAPVCIVILISSISYSSVLSYLNIYAVERDLANAASFFFVVYAAVLLVTRPFTGKLFDRRGANIIIYPALLLLACGLALLGLAESALPLLLSAILIGLGFGNIMSCGQALVVNLVEPHKLGLATSTFYIFIDAGLGFGPFLLGFFIPLLGYGNLYIALGGLSIINMALYFLLHGQHQNKSEKCD